MTPSRCWRRPDAGARTTAVPLKDRLGAPHAAGGSRNVEKRAEEIQAALRADYLEAPRDGRGTRIPGQVVDRPRRGLHQRDRHPRGGPVGAFEQHPDAKVVLSLPGLGTVLGARVLGEFGDDRTRSARRQVSRNSGGTSPVTKASGRAVWSWPALPETGVWAIAWTMGLLFAHQVRRGPALLRPAATRGKTHRQATRQLANRWVGILHYCLEREGSTPEEIAWRPESRLAA